MNKKHAFSLEKWKLVAILMMIFDFITIAFSYFFGLWVRFDFIFTSIPEKYLSVLYKLIIPYALMCIIIYWFYKMYRGVWRFASFNELTKTLYGTTTCGILCFIITRLFGARMPWSFHIIGFVLQTAFAIIVRFMHRFILLIRSKKNENKCENVMIIGAGSAGQLIIRDINKNIDSDLRVVCVIDDDNNVIGRYIEGIPVVGGREDILKNVEKYEIEQIYFAIPTATNSEKRDILNICKETNCEIKVLPGIQQIVNGDVSVSTMKNVAIEDLLGRDVVKVNNEEILNHISDKVVLVTGGGGSIGSELCRQIAKNNPKKLIIFDIYEMHTIFNLN